MKRFHDLNNSSTIQYPSNRKRWKFWKNWKLNRHFPGSPVVKNPPSMQVTQIWSLVRVDPASGRPTKPCTATTECLRRNYCSLCTAAREASSEKPWHRTQGQPPCTATGGSPRSHQDPDQPQINTEICVLQGSHGQFGRCGTVTQSGWHRDTHTCTGRSCHNPLHVFSSPTRCHTNCCTYYIYASFQHAFS